jgi:hypothetical protein
MTPAGPLKKKLRKAVAPERMTQGTNEVLLGTWIDRQVEN